MYSRNNIFGYSNQKKEMKRRTFIIAIIFMLLFSFLVWRVVYNMYIKGPARKTMADAQYRIEEPYGLRYNLIDCKGKDLLDYKVNYYVIIDPIDYSRFNEYTSKFDLESLTFILRNYNNIYDLDRIRDISNGDKVKWEIDEQTFDKLQDIKEVKGFYTYAANEVVRDKIWKIENLLINTKHYKPGVKNPVVKSDDSLEMQVYNKTKNNEYERIRFDKGADGQVSKGEIIKPENNINVRLTLNKEIQEKVETILHDEKYKGYGQIGVVLMESNNGKIRAMVQKDDNASNANLGILGTNGFYAGSIFKVIVDEAGLDTNLIDNYKKYTIDGTLFPDSHEKFNQYTVAEALSYSSNDIFAQLGWKIGFQNMYDYAEKQGMLGKVLNFEEEQKGKFEVDLLSPKVDDISHSAIGQKVRITPLEALSIPNTIINNGVYVKPSIIDAYVNDDNEVLEEITTEKYPVLKRETAETVKLHMLGVVNKGTGNLAYIKNMGIGGKTGTSEYYVGGKKHSDGWFVGFFQLRGKNYSMVVFVPEIYVNEKDGNKQVKQVKKDEEGGDTAAPIFKEIVNALIEIDQKN
jgi:cell division protein FtsI/penicillin-binding protein 2